MKRKSEMRDHLNCRCERRRPADHKEPLAGGPKPLSDFIPSTGFAPSNRRLLSEANTLVSLAECKGVY